MKDITSNWRMRRADARELKPELINPDTADSEWPILSFGGWLSPDNPAFEYYRRPFEAASNADCWMLHFEGITVKARVFVNGNDAGDVHPFDPFMDITSYVAPGNSVQVAVFIERSVGQLSGNVKVYEGVQAEGWRLSAAEEEGLLRCAEGSRGNAAQTSLPVAIEPGRMAWLHAAVSAQGEGKGWRVRVTGSGMKMTVFFEGRLVGRLWLPGGEERPRVCGGSPDSFWLPAPWFREDGAASGLDILLEAVVQEQSALIESLEFYVAGRPVSRN